MARYRGILRAAAALVLLLPAAWRADAQDMLVIDSGGARWKSGESGKPSVTVDFGAIDALSADRRRGAFRRPDRRARRYLTLSIPQPEPPALPGRYDPPAPAELAAAPAADAPPGALPPALPDPREPAAAPAAETAAGPPVPAVSKPPAPPAALPARRAPAAKTEATPALRAFLDRAKGTNGARGASPAKPLRAQPPLPRPIQPRRSESGAAASAGLEMRFRLPPPAPATSPAPAGGLPPPPPATGTPETGRLPPPARADADAPEPRRPAALDTSALPVAAPPAAAGHAVTFLYGAGGTALDAEDRARLGGLAAALAREAGLGVEIRAYAGSAGSDGVETRREALSRAMEVRRLLIAAGVPEARIVARAAGAGGEAGARVDVVLVGRS